MSPEREAAFPIVGVGASAGGLEALAALLKGLPADTGMGFVIIQHLSPNHVSNLAGILARETSMTVTQVSGDTPVRPDHVYVVPPGSDLTLEQGVLRLHDQERSARRHGIDRFFESLAQDCGRRGVAVVLSGEMNDGTLGLEFVKAEGGITFAQDDSARHEGMPQSAVAAGCVDFVLPPAAIAAELARIARHPYVRLEQQAGEPAAFSHHQIVRILHRETGMDFTQYKANTLRRRIIRRMVLNKLGTPQEYEEYLVKNREEAGALCQDILINVTSFFRDPEAFAALSSRTLPEIIQAHRTAEPVRIWTLGCSTGQEAYSLAMTYLECAEAAGSSVPVQIFATDLNDVGVGIARAGLYTKSIEHEVSAERLQRFFTEEEGGYRIRREIRERCVFSRHDVAADPPFSRLDFISCRNVLIYMEAELQQQVMLMLHYALKPEGCLWLGNSETAGSSRNLFEVEDQRHKIYRRRAGPSPPGTRFRSRTADLLGTGYPEGSGPRKPSQSGLHKEAERVLLSRYAPPSVVVTPGLEIVHFRGDTGPYLAPGAGTASLHLLRMLREGLLMGVRGAILRAGEQGARVREEGLRVVGRDGFREVAVEVIPLSSQAQKEAGFLIIFDETERQQAALQAVPPIPAHDAESEMMRLTRELGTTREYLQSVIEQQESINEELQSAIEEAQSANEEMQSVNEELETSKEEIQSSNEELVTVNDELNNRNKELHTLNRALEAARDYAEGIVASVRSPLVVLDANLCVKRASASFYEAFGISPAETENRPIYKLGHGQWDIPALRTLLEDVLPYNARIDDFEMRATFEHSGPRVMLLNARQFGKGGAEETLIVLGIQDVTDLRTHEDSLIARANDLLNADRSKDEFLAMLAHELRNPLGPLRTAAEILQTPGASAEDHQGAQTILGRQIENMTRMIDDLLDIARITEGKIELRKQVVALASILQPVAAAAESRTGARGQTFTLSLPPGPVFLNADSTRLEQVFENLLNNASKYSGEGCHISLSAERVARENGDAEVHVRVRDNGGGITPELLPRIFDLFVQATRAMDRAHGGLGIGLTIVQRLVKLHGGRVVARSSGAGLGSEFTVTLPLLAGPEVLAPTAPSPPRSVVPRRMLIVDDNKDAVASMSTLQRLRGHHVQAAGSGPQALDIAATFQPEVVLLDIGLPGMDGYEVARRLRDMPGLEGIFIVAVSGYGSPADMARAKEAGFDKYLVKPADLRLLSTWLQELE